MQHNFLFKSASCVVGADTPIRSRVRLLQEERAEAPSSEPPRDKGGVLVGGHAVAGDREPSANGGGDNPKPGVRAERREREPCNGSGARQATPPANVPTPGALRDMLCRRHRADPPAGFRSDALAPDLLAGLPLSFILTLMPTGWGAQQKQPLVGFYSRVLQTPTPKARTW